MKEILIRDISTNNKPRERLQLQGSQALSDAEILAIILRTGSKNYSAISLAHYLLKKYGGLEKLLNSSFSSLVKTKGVGIAKACSIVACNEMSKRTTTDSITQSEIINNPKDIFKYIKKLTKGKKQEHLYLISMNSKRKIIWTDLISKGSVTEAFFPLREIIRKALDRDAVIVALVHNHPSQIVKPSIEDITVTQKLLEACETVGLEFLDHVIVSDHSYFSIKSTNLN